VQDVPATAAATAAAASTTSNARQVRSPEWSLGVADTSGKLFRPTDAAQPYVFKTFRFVRVTIRYFYVTYTFALFFCRYITRYFSGGQQCDETQKGRKSEVQIHCCASRSHLPPHLLSVEEPSKCKCVPRNSSSCPSLFLFIRKCPLILKICLRFAFPSFMHRYVLKVCAPSMCAADVAQSSADERASSMVAAAARASLNLDENGRVRGDEAGVSFFLS